MTEIHALIMTAVFLMLFVINFMIVVLLLVIIHECGHYIVAKWLNVKINEFSIGFGSIWYCTTSKEGIRWTLRHWPIGGYVDFTSHQLYWKQALVNLAGPSANFLFAFIVLALSVLIEPSGLDELTYLSVNYSQQITSDVVKTVTLDGMSNDNLLGWLEQANILTEKSNWIVYLETLAKISFLMGVLNLMPVLPLDGGQFVFNTLEAVLRKPIPKWLSRLIALAGLIIIGIFLLIAFSNDVAFIYSLVKPT